MEPRLHNNNLWMYRKFGNLTGKDTIEGFSNGRATLNTLIIAKSELYTICTPLM